MIYPGDDEKVLRVARKCVAGLTHVHGLGTALPDPKIWVDILRFRLPPEMEAALTFRGSEPEVVKYAFVKQPFEEVEMLWLIEFFERTRFIGVVSSHPIHPARLASPHSTLPNAVVKREAWNE